MRGGGNLESEGGAGTESPDDRFRALADHATDLVAEFDSGGRFLYASPSYLRLLGYEPEELVGTVPNDLIHPEDRRQTRSTFSHAVTEEGESYSIHRLRHRDGSWRWFDNTGRAYRTTAGEIRFVSVGRDITETRRSQEALARRLAAEQRLLELSRGFLSASADGLREALSGALREAAEIARADRAHLTAARSGGRGFHVYSHDPTGSPAMVPDACPWIAERGRRGEPIRIADLDDLPAEALADRAELVRRDVASMLGVPLRAAGSLVGVLGFESAAPRSWSDDEITLVHLAADLFAGALGRIEAEAELEQSRLQLAQVQKMEAVGRLAGGIAHDFNNLLMVMAGFSASLVEELPAGHPAAEDAQEIERAVEQAGRLTRQLLTLSRRQVVQAERVDLNAAIAGMEGLLRGLLGEELDLRLDRDATLPHVRADRGQLEQVLVNLAMNARQAMQSGGSLRVSTRTRLLDDGGARAVGLRGAGTHVALSVRDTGHGIDEAIQSRAFEPFFTTRARGEGTGLGLSIVYGIVRQWGGAISLRSRPGEGTLVEIVLPGLEPASESAAEQDPRPGRGGSEIVLLVEDEAPVRRLIRSVLQRNGYRVIEAVDGEHALAAERRHGDTIDLLVTDVVMPRMGGVELAQRLRARRAGLPVLFVSGYPQEAPASEGKGVEGVEGVFLDGGFLQKPCTPAELLEKVRRTLDEAG